MGVGEDFKSFCGNLTVTNREEIGKRYQQITRRLNIDFWNYGLTHSRIYTDHSFYSGSYGRGTAIGFISDLDMIFELPSSLYTQYNNHLYNGQSALLQAVSKSIQNTYSSTKVGGDGQVVVVSFGDGVKFEVVPAFLNTSGSYTYPDSNGGGSWRTTNPKPEIAAIASRDLVCKGNLKWLCRMARAWKSVWSVPVRGLLIDTLAYQFIEKWEYRDKSFLYYDFMSRDFFDFMANQSKDQEYWRAPGSGQYVWGKDLFQWKARRCYNISLEAIDYGTREMHYSARKKWREIYGTAYPG